MARKKGKGTEFAVFKGREAKLNRAIFEILATMGPQTISNLQKQTSKYRGLRGTYYASVSKRIRCLKETGYITQVKPAIEGAKAVAYELRPKVYLASFLNLTSMEDLLSQITDAKAAIILLALINAVPPDKGN
jgi:hypothetical protein